MSLLLAVQGGSSTNYTLTALAGTYSLSGGSAVLTKATGAISYTLTANAGTYALAGGTASLRVGRKITANAGSYSLTGGSASLSVGRKLTALAGSYSITGGNAVLTKAGSTAYTLTALAGSYSLTGGEATLSWSGESSKAGGYDDEPKKKRFIVEKNGKLLVFNTAQAALDAEERTEIKKNIPAKKKKAVTVDLPAVQPEVSIDLSAVQAYADLMGLIEQYNAAYNSARYEALIALFEQMQDEDDIETLLLAG